MDEESRIERKLTLQAKKMGGMAVKFTSPGLDAGQNCIVAWEEDRIRGIKGSGEEAAAPAGEKNEAA